MIGECTDHIEIACAYFIEGCDTPRKESFLVGNQEAKALTYTDVCTDTRGKTIISRWITVGLLRPEFVAEHGVEIKTARQWL